MTSTYQDFLAQVCGVPKPGGTTTTIYYLCKGELTNGMPDTAKVIKELATPGSSELGDAKIYGEPFDLASAPQGEGFWRRANCIIDEQELKDIIEGSLGNVGIANMFSFKLAGGITPASSETNQTMVDHDGCGIFMVKLRNGFYAVIGSVDSPCFVEASEGTTGKALGDGPGYVLSLRSNSGLSTFFYDADTHGIDITPNP
jgi:hypothetical protein